jgi:hypothetical protein
MSEVIKSEQVEAASVQQWDYAQLIYTTKDGNVSWVEVDATERKDIQDSFVTFQEGMAKSKVAVKDIPYIYYLNIAGRYGWELILERDESDGSLFTMKKIHE